VTTDNAHFDSVETSLQRGYFEVSKEDDLEYFHPESKVTREELAKILYIIGNLKNDNSISIGDIEDIQNTRIVKSVVSNSLIELESGMFNPEKAVSKDEVFAALEALQVISNDNM
jgi:iron complex transport system substrate-binding protein